MAYYYKIPFSEKAKISVAGILAYQDSYFKTSPNEHCAKFDFTKHVLIELLDDVTPEEKLWEELDLTCKARIIHKRLMVDAHRVHCRRAIVICVDSEEAKYVAQRLSQTKVFKRCVCAAVVQDLLSDMSLFEKQIIRFGDRRSQEKLIFVTDLNRFREPESQVQYLQKLFSPFGRILSIFVAKAENGYAYPEGVVLFSYLSEAFAAELAYDQRVVGLERLSVTVHHNILLSQCDLRMRLKEAQVKNEFINNISFVENKHMLESKYGQNELFFPVGTFRGRNKRKSNFLCEMHYHKSDVDTNENSCQDNMTHCLEHTAICCENFFSTKSVNEKHIVVDSNNVQIPEKSACFIDNSLINTVPLPEHSMLDSINLTDISNLSSSTVELTYPLNCSIRDDTTSKIVDDNNLTDTGLKCEDTTNANNKYPEEIFIHSALLSDKPLLKKSVLKNNKLLKVSNLTSPKKCHICKKMLNACERSGNCDITLVSDNLDVNCLSETKKNSSLSQKLSLKKQRFNSIFFPCDETTLILPTIYAFGACNAIPKCTYEKLKSEKFHRDISQISKSCFHTRRSFDNTTLAFNQCFDKEILNDGKIRNGSNSLTVHRVSETAFCQQNNISQKGRKSKLKKECPLELVTIPSCNKNSGSPLKTWLKEELIYSTNNRVADCTKNSRKIVCATPKRDVLVPVGCSNMTCNFCYPKSTNLLFGFS